MQVTPRTCAQFAADNEKLANWKLEGRIGPAIVYTSDQSRMNISFEIASNLEYVGAVMARVEDEPIDYSQDFANSLVDQIRGNMSAAHCQALLLRLAKELSEWQFEPGCEKSMDICGETLTEMRSIQGFGR